MRKLKGASCRERPAEPLPGRQSCGFQDGESDHAAPRSLHELAKTSRAAHFWSSIETCTGSRHLHAVQ